MVSAALKGIKLTLNLEEGSQTISGCNAAATNEQLYALGDAVSELEAKRVDSIVKVEESILVKE